MAQFLRPSKKSLTNAQHYEFMDVFITVLTEAGFTAAKITVLLSQLRTAFAEEDRWYMIARASEIIALREAADKRRDNFYGRLHAVIKAWAGSGIAAMEPAANKLKKLFDLYKVNTSAQIDAESGQLDNLSTDLSASEMQSALQTLGVMPLYQAMVEAHQETKSYRLEQGVEESEKVAGALRKARKDTDGLYDELTYLIEAFAKTADDPAPYEAFIKKWNGTLKIYQDMLNRKSGSASGGSSSNGGGTNNGGGTTPTTPDTPGTGNDTPGTDTPGTDTPGTGGDNTGGGTTDPGTGDNTGGDDYHDPDGGTNSDE